MLIGITGRASSGKSTLAKTIANHAGLRGYSARIYEVSHIILRYCQKAGLITAGKTREECTPTDIQTLITVGQQKRDENPGYWLDQISELIRLDAADVAIVPNVRANNEADFVRSKGGILVRIVSTNPDGTDYVAMDRDPNHRFETISLTLSPNYEIKTPRGAESLAKSYARSLFDFLAHKESE